jgi:hypothetical protein
MLRKKKEMRVGKGVLKQIGGLKFPLKYSNLSVGGCRRVSADVGGCL